MANYFPLLPYKFYIVRTYFFSADSHIIVYVQIILHSKQCMYLSIEMKEITIGGTVYLRPV